ncbi:MAG TPA: diguanylate cyclase [Candidatus Nanopelagicaceae bacterium]|nr:diguanylate cyclase [Candidatus Nanopelagicaceae bacterium]
MAAEPAVDPGRARFLVRHLCSSLAAGSWRNPYFWTTQAMVLGVLGIHFVDATLYREGVLPIPPFVTVVLALVPVGYAAMRFGLRGSLPTALWVGLLLVPNVILVDVGVLRWAEATMLLLLVAIAAAAGRLVDLERASTRRQVEAARLRGVTRVADQLMDGVCVTDRAGTIAYANRAWAQLQGLASAEDAVGRSLEAFHDPGGVGREQMPFERSSNPDEPQRSVVAHHLPNGRMYWADVSSTPLLDDHDQVIGRLSTVRDVTRDRETTAALKEAEERSRLIFERAPLGMATVSLDGRYLQVNAALGRMVGLSAAQMVGTEVVDLTVADDRGKTREVLEQRAPEQQFVKRYIHREGHLVWVQVTASLMRHPDGEPWYFISQYQDVTEEQLRRQQLVRQAFHDPLTGLPNRLLLEDRLERALTRTRRQRHRVAVLFCDLDGLKAINDRLGHQAGDLVLCAVADRLRGSIREVDTAARLGGDEFVVLLDGLTGSEQATATAARILDAIRRPFRLGEELVPIRISVGVAISSGANNTAEGLLRGADTTMYLAKLAGGDGFQVADPGTPASTRGSANARPAAGGRHPLGTPPKSGAEVD